MGLSLRLQRFSTTRTSTSEEVCSYSTESNGCFLKKAAVSRWSLAHRLMGSRAQGWPAAA